jgi:hypothetical protein
VFLAQNRKLLLERTVAESRFRKAGGSSLTTGRSSAVDTAHALASNL